jgi:TonB-dependent SusC/RagA subfamily outer membrane receptor
MSTTRWIGSTLSGAAALVAAACAHHAAPRSGAAPVDSVQIGYGAQPKDKKTGAVTTLGEGELGARPLQIEQLLRGKVAGLEVVQEGNKVSFRIRGTKPFGADQEPLVIVDDVMIQSGSIASALAGLTPDDIKQVSVLKDVASTSIYGGRGAAGVIIITTKAKKPNE